MDIKKIDRVFITALFASLIWHLFWISSVAIVVAPDKPSPVRFSRVAFLGPILERGMTEVSIEPRTQTFLEKRYAYSAGETYRADSVINIKPSAGKYDGQRRGFFAVENEKLTAVVDEAVSGQKLEPLPVIE